MPAVLLALAVPSFSAGPRKAATQPVTPPRPTAELIEDLHANAPETQLPAIMELMRRREKSAAMALESCLDSSEPRVRIAATIALGTLRAEPQARAVLALLEDSAPRVRLAALFALARITRTPPLKAMAARLDDPSDLVRGGACRVFVSLNETRLLPSIRKKLNDPSLFVRLEALRAMIALKSSLAQRELAQAMGDENPVMRFQAARYMSQLGDRRAVPALRKAAFGDEDRDVQVAALAALGRIATPRQCKEIVLALFRQTMPEQSAANRDQRSWEQINQEIAWRGRRLAALGRPAMKWLLLTLQDKDPIVQQTSLVTLKSIGDGRSLAYIKPLLASPNKNVAARAKAAYDAIKERGKTKK